MTTELPRYIGPYRIQGILGRGGMGVVYRGVEEATGAVVAVKTVRGLHPSVLKGIRREIRSLARLRHPGIVRIVAEGMWSEVPWYAMEHLDGPTLLALVDSAQPACFENTLVAPALTGEPTDLELPAIEETAAFPEAGDASGQDGAAGAAATPPELPPRLLPALATIARLCDVLAYLHGLGIVHRDLKPENVFVRADGQPVLVDFGIAARGAGLLSTDELSAHVGATGTVSYMAPEQIRGEVVDARADLYSLGCILYQIAAGRPPFLGESDVIVAGMHLVRPVEPPSKHAPDVSAELDRLVLDLLAKDPAHRLSHPAAVAACLETMGVPVPPPPPPSAARVHSVLPFRPRLVGRSEAVSTLGRLLASARDKRGCIGLLLGKAGCGKTRLALEACQLAERHGFRLLAATGSPQAQAPGNSLRRVIEELLDDFRADGSATDRERALRDLACVLAPSTESTLPPRAARLRAVTALWDLLRGATAEGERPVLLVLDNLPHLDALTLELVSAAMQAKELGSLPMLMLLTAEPDRVPREVAPLMGRDLVTSVTVGDLDAAQTERMIGDMLGARMPPQALTAAIREASGGNPMLVAELVRSAAAIGVLARNHRGQLELRGVGAGSGGGGGGRGGGGGGAAAAALEGLREALPRDLDGALKARLGVLSEAAVHLAQAAAAAAEIGSMDALRAVSGMTESAFEESFAEIEALALVDEVYGDRFKLAHRRLREVARGTAERARWRRLNAACADWIVADAIRERSYGVLVGALRLEAGQRTRAIAAYKVTAERSAAAGQYDFAERCFRVLGKILRVPAELAVSDLDFARLVLIPTGRYGQATRWLQAAARAAEAAQDAQTAMSCALALATVDRLCGHRDRAETELLRIAATGRSRQQPRIVGEALRQVAVLYFETGRMEPAMQMCERALAIHRAAGDRIPEASALNNLAAIHRSQGRIELAVKLYEEALAILERAGAAREASMTITNRANCMELVGNVAAAEAEYRRALAVFRRMGDLPNEGWVLGNLAQARASSGAHDEALELAAQALALHERAGDDRLAGAVLQITAWVHRIRGDYSAALDAGRRAGERHRAARDLANAAETLCEMAAANIQAGRATATTRRWLERAIELSRAVGAPETEMSCWCWMGQLAMRRGSSPARELREIDCIAPRALPPRGELAALIADMRSKAAATPPPRKRSVSP
ncbi:MAG: tetratricopeptide repeat protein [Candidatus Schekmanbacteria bacterium]|nr:tetratricopeptide repeat protein [Candidatus Schekmanbacteria bacterium]